MDSCEKEFESAGQEARRLAIALKRFTEVQDPVWKEKYQHYLCLLYTSPSPRDRTRSRMPSSA